MTMIDLGEVTTATAEPAAVPVNVPRLRRLALAVLAVLGLLTLTASVPPATPVVRQLWTADFQPSDTMALDDTTAYLNRTSNSGPPQVTAYDLATGKIRWAAPTGAAVADYGLRTAGDVLLVPSDPLLVERDQPDGSRFFHQVSRSTLALDAATGRQLWRSAGDAVPSVVTGDVLLAESDQFGSVTRLRLVGLRDGHEVWKRAIPPAEQWTTVSENGRPTTIVATTKVGDTTVYGYADGAVRYHARLPWNGVYSATLDSAGPYLVVARTASAQTVATVYRPADLHPLWRADDLLGYATVCGPLICTAGARGVSGRDPATGRVLWQRTDMADTWDVGDGRLILTTANDRPNTTTVLVDGATGRTVGRPLGGQQTYSARPRGAMFLLRPTTAPAGRTEVSRLDLADGRQTVLGTIGPLGDQWCREVPGYLVCPRDDTLTVTAAG